MSIGIDLGTTNSVVAYWTRNRPEVIENNEGKRVTASSLVVTNNNAILVGNNTVARPEKEVSDVKRIIGKKFKEIQSEIGNYPFKIIGDHLGNLKIEVPSNPSAIIFTPEEVSHHILSKIVKQSKERMESRFNNSAVITVPAYFNNAQRAATKKAAEMAGLTVLRLLNEPTAAALAYVFKEQPKEKRRVLIYDWGGGTFDVSIIDINNKTIDVKAIDGHTHLGGKDVDDKLVKYVRGEMEKKGVSFDERKKYRNLRRLLRMCQEAKHELSNIQETEIIFEENEDSLVELTRDKLNELTEDIFKKTMTILDHCLTTNQIEKKTIDEVLLVGGSSRICKINQLLEEYFGKDKIQKKVAPDEAVALGAAVYANMHETNNFNYTLNEVLSFSLGTDVQGNQMSVILAKNQALPAKNTKVYVNSREDQTQILVRIFEGESRNVEENSYLGVVRITFPKAAKFEVKIKVTFVVDLDGILQVTAEDVNGSTSLKIALNRH